MFAHLLCTTWTFVHCEAWAWVSVLLVCMSVCVTCACCVCPPPPPPIACVRVSWIHGHWWMDRWANVCYYHPHSHKPTHWHAHREKLALKHPMGNCPLGSCPTSLENTFFFFFLYSLYSCMLLLCIAVLLLCHWLLDLFSSTGRHSFLNMRRDNDVCSAHADGRSTSKCALTWKNRESPLPY